MKGGGGFCLRLRCVCSTGYPCECPYVCIHMYVCVHMYVCGEYGSEEMTLAYDSYVYTTV